MDLIGLLRELSGTGISDFVFIGVALLVARYWLSGMRRDISGEIDEKLGAFKADLEESIKANRQEITAIRTSSRQDFNAARAYSEQSHKDIMLHLLDVRERLANLEGRLGGPTPRMSAVSPPLEAPAEEPSTESQSASL